jgi:hypothetical protein
VLRLPGFPPRALMFAALVFDALLLEFIYWLLMIEKKK